MQVSRLVHKTIVILTQKKKQWLKCNSAVTELLPLLDIITTIGFSIIIYLNLVWKRQNKLLICILN